LLDLHGNGGLREVQLLRCAGEGKVPRDRLEHPQLAQSEVKHGVSSGSDQAYDLIMMINIINLF
jgi:hypothetical protein